MDQKTRNEITEILNANISPNNNKEITANKALNVFRNLRDSFFNLKDDLLKDVKYNNTKTLDQYLSDIVGAVPLWGSTDYFNVGSSSGDIEDYSDKGIVQSMLYTRSSSRDSEIVITTSKSIVDRKISVNVYYGGQSSEFNNDICVPVIRIEGTNRIYVGLREVSSRDQKIRLEILAFKVEK